jgi:hypothetical protein
MNRTTDQPFEYDKEGVRMGFRIHVAGLALLALGLLCPRSRARSCRSPVTMPRSSAASEARAPRRAATMTDC